MATEIIACTRVCKKCGAKETSESFVRNIKTLCVDCKKIWKREYYQKHKDKWSEYKRLPRVRERSRRRREAMSVEARNNKLTRERYRQIWMKYGITADEYDKICGIQGGCCAICRKKPNGNLVVDHDHKTTKVRGLLCVSCNSAIGPLGDSTEGLMIAIAYLNHPPADLVVDYDI